MQVARLNYFKTHDRYFFQGQEMDNEVKGEGNSYDFGARMYNCRLGIFLSIDPLANQRAWMSPYNFVQNNPIMRIDPDGLLDDNYTITENGSVSVEKTDDKTDSFTYVDENGKETNLGTYNKTDNGLLVVPKGVSEIYMNNSKESKSYINPISLAGILGAGFEYYTQTGLKIQINQLNNKEGGHSAHGGDGGFADIRYANLNGNKNESVWTTGDNFDQENSQILANKFYKFGYNLQFGILTENAKGNGPALNNTYFVDGSKSTPPFHHKHHMHLQHINLKLETTIEEVIIYPK